MKKILAMLCFAVVVLAGCGKTEQGASSEKPTEAAATTEAVTTEADTTEAVTTVEAVTTAADITEPETTTHEADVSAGGRMDMYPAVFQGEIRRVFDETVKAHDGIASVEYAFRDLDADGIPELILKYGSCEADYQIHIYRFDEECELQDLGVFGGGHTSFCYDENTGDFVILWGHMGAASIQYYKWQDGTLKSYDHYDFNLDEQTPSYDDVLNEKGVRYIEFVSAYQFSADSGITSWLYHPNGTHEEFEGLYLDNIG